MDPNPIFQQRLKDAREMRGFTRAALSMRTGLPQNAVSQFESGKRPPNIGHLERLADALEVSIDRLLGRNAPDDLGVGLTSRLMLSYFDRMTARDRLRTVKFLQRLTEVDASIGDL